MVKLSIIVAMSKNGVIGVNNQLPWHLPEDLKHFKKLTMGHHLILGRKTFESLNTPFLIGRTLIVISRTLKIQEKNVISASSIEDAMQIVGHDPEPFLIGGGELYEIGIKYAQKIYLTLINKIYQGDRIFPCIDEISKTTLWKLIESSEEKTSITTIPFFYQTYSRLPHTSSTSLKEQKFKAIEI